MEGRIGQFLTVCAWVFLPGLSLVLAVANALKLPSPPAKQAATLTLKDGRRLAYEVRGDLTRANKVFWNHGIISSRHAPWQAKLLACSVLRT